MNIINIPGNFTEMALISEGLLGGITALLEKGVVPQTFGDPHHQLIFATMVDLWHKGEPVTLPTVGGRLSGSPQAIVKLAEASDQGRTTQNLDYLISVAKIDSRKRATIEHGEQLLAEAKSSLSGEEYDFLERMIASSGFEMAESVNDRMSENLNDSTLEAIERDIVAGGVRCIRTGIKKLDHLLGGGLKPGKLVTIAARPGCGKTALATNIALFSAHKSFRSLYITIELNSAEITERHYCTEGAINTRMMASRQFDEDSKERLVAAARRIHNLPLAVNSTTGGSWAKVELAIKTECTIKNAELIIIDYIQQFHLEDKKLTPREEITYMTGRCKQLAMAYQVPIIMVAQLNRDLEKRADNIPQMSDLKESGSIEQDSDIIIMLFKKKVDEVEKLACKIAKNRSGETGNFFIHADFSINKFYEGE